MATSTQTITTAVTDDTTFRTFVTNFKAGLEAAGLVVASDTGQINTSTVTKPAASNTVAGYTVHRFDDSLQSGSGSLPVFIKTEYGTSSSATIGGLWLTVGTATNGAGTLSGQLGTRFQYTAQSATAATYYFSGENSNRITVAGNLGTATTVNNFVLNIERLRSSTGAVTANGISTLYSLTGSSSNQLTQHQVIPASGSTLTQSEVPVWPDPKASLALNDNVYFQTHFPISFQLHQPNVGLIKYFNSDVTSGSDITCGVYGSNATYKCLGPIRCGKSLANYGFIGTDGSIALAIRWQ